MQPPLTNQRKRIVELAADTFASGQKKPYLTTPIVVQVLVHVEELIALQTTIQLGQG